MGGNTWQKPRNHRPVISELNSGTAERETGNEAEIRKLPLPAGFADFKENSRPHPSARDQDKKILRNV
jgi:hypothetical protein